MPEKRTHKLYILMRNDMESMNAGKACAQASHAANAFISHSVSGAINWDSGQAPIFVREWANETTQGFGTAIVLGAKIEDIMTSVDRAVVAGYIAGVVHDPSYPVKDGQTVHLIPLDTCAYIFVPDDGSNVSSRTRLDLQAFKLY